MPGEQPRQIRPWAILKAVAIAIATYLVAAGFDFTTPEKRFQSQDLRIVANSVRIDSLALQQQVGFSVLFKLACVDKRFSERDRQLAGLDCDAVFRAHSSRGTR